MGFVGCKVFDFEVREEEIDDIGDIGCLVEGFDVEAVES